jgi:hypothetical protein
MMRRRARAAYSRGDGRFCGSKCRQAYDDGFMPSEVISKPRDGVSLVCRGCGRQFVSKSLRCCSIACERQSHARSACGEIRDGGEPQDR